jgi:hypothetical protein
MPLSTFVRSIFFLPFFTVPAYRSQSPAAGKVQLTLATLHAAALTSPRPSSDSVDAPYYLVSVLGPRAKSETLHLPTSGHLLIHQDEALGARPLIDLSLEPGDSIRVLVSVLEGKSVQASEETTAATASTNALSQPASARVAAVSSALSPVLSGNRARWLGSATLLLTNEAGTIYWRALECLATCKVLSGAGAAALPAESGAHVSGVVELSGAGGTYHMQLQGQRAQ